MAAKLMGKIVQEVNDLSSIEKVVLLVLANYFNTDLDEAFPSQDTIAKNSSLSRSSVVRALDALQNKGYITIKKRRSRANSRTMYSNPPCVRQRHGNQRQGRWNGCHVSGERYAMCHSTVSLR